MGRRMNISEKFTSPPVLACGWPARSRLCAIVLGGNPGPRRQAKLTVGDYSFAEFQALINHQFLIDSDTGGYRPRLHRAVRFHHEYKFALLPGLDGLIGHHQGIGLSGKPQHHADELARPKLAVRILKSSF